MKQCTIHNIVLRSLLACVTCVAIGCSSHKSADNERKVFGVSVRRYEAPPVYKRTRLVQLPAPVPVARRYKATAPLMLPVIHFELTDASLEEAARILGETSRYSSYCASTIAEKRITLTALGTVDELARKISKLAQVETVVDHHNREIRFLANSESPEVTKPQLLN